MAVQWTWELIPEEWTKGLGEFIRLCNRRFRDLQQKVASLVSLPSGGGTAGTFPVWDSTGAGLSDGALSHLASPSRVVSTRGIRLPFNSSIFSVSESGSLEYSLIKLFTGDVVELLGSWHIASADGNLRPVADDTFDVGSSAKRVRIIYVSDGMVLGTTPASTGLLRLPNAQGVLFRDQANTSDMTMIASNTSDEVVIRGTWKASSSDAWAPTTDNAQDIGTGALRVRDAYIARDIEGSPGGCPFVVDGWYQDNVAASQTDVELTRATGRFRAVRAGSVLGVVVTSTEARTAGTLTVTVFKNTGLAGAAGSSIGLTAVLDGTNTSRKATTQAKDTDTFAAGDELYAVVTTDGSWTPTTADIRVAIEIES